MQVHIVIEIPDEEINAAATKTARDLFRMPERRYSHHEDEGGKGIQLMRAQLDAWAKMVDWAPLLIETAQRLAPQVAESIVRDHLEREFKKQFGARVKAGMVPLDALVRLLEPESDLK